MKDNAFFDTNLLIYLYSSDDINKKNIIFEKIQEFNPIISIQVINELSNVLIKKFKIDELKVIEAIAEINDIFEIKIINFATIVQALQLKSDYKYSYYDSLIISSAIASDCNVLLTEDLQHKQYISNNLQIINPFNQK